MKLPHPVLTLEMKPVLQVRSLAVSVVIPSGMKILGFPPRYRLTIVNPMLAASLIRSPVPLRVPGTRVVSEPSAPEEDERSIVRTSESPMNVAMRLAMSVPQWLRMFPAKLVRSAAEGGPPEYLR